MDFHGSLLIIFLLSNERNILKKVHFILGLYKFSYVHILIMRFFYKIKSTIYFLW